MSEQPADVAIVGGGPVGLLMGILLAQRGVRIKVLERRAEPRLHSRAIGIHPPALDVLEAAGVAEPILARAVHIRAGVLRSRGKELGGLRFDALSGRFRFVAALPQHQTETILAQRLTELAPGALCRRVEVTGAAETEGAVRISFSQQAGGAAGEQGEITARFLVGADGAYSFVRSAAGIGTRSKRFRDTYLMGDFTDNTGDGQNAVIWLEPGGVVESFPLPGNLRRWVIRTARLEPNTSAAQLSELIAERTGMQVPAESNSMLSAFGVRGQRAYKMYAGRTLLIGDAAHEVSPIGGQGMNLGWLDAAALAPVLEDAVSAGGHWPSRISAVSRTRLRAAATAGALATVNMAMGRPVPGLIAGPRDAALRMLLASPARGRLARAYSMRWL